MTLEYSKCSTRFCFPWMRPYVSSQIYASSAARRAYLLGVKLLPALVVKLLEELQNEDWVNKVDECIANVAPVLRTP